jgi:flagellar assembly factor FliW
MRTTATPTGISPVLAMSPRLTVPSDLLGPLDVTEDQIIVFEAGIAGFRQCTQWILIDGERPGTAWLQSADQGSLAFLLVDPFLFFDGYSVDLSPHDARQLQAENAAQLAVFAIVTIPAKSTDVATANLQGPIVINVARRRAAQIVLNDGPWGVRQPFHLLPHDTAD